MGKRLRLILHLQNISFTSMSASFLSPAEDISLAGSNLVDLDPGLLDKERSHAANAFATAGGSSFGLRGMARYRARALYCPAAVTGDGTISAKAG